MVLILFLLLTQVYYSSSMELYGECETHLMPVFNPSEPAAHYYPLKKIARRSDIPHYAPQIPLEKKLAFFDCLNALSAQQLKTQTLKDILDDPILLEAIISAAPLYSFRNELIRFFFFGSLLYEKHDTYEFFLNKNIDLVKIRSVYNETPAAFVSRLTKEGS